MRRTRVCDGCNGLQLLAVLDVHSIDRHTRHTETSRAQVLVAHGDADEVIDYIHCYTRFPKTPREWDGPLFI